MRQSCKVYEDNHVQTADGNSQGAPTGVKALGRQLIAGGGLQLDLLAIRAHQGVLLRVEGQVARNGKRSDQLR